MGFLVSNCERCIHKEVCGIKDRYKQFVENVSIAKDYAEVSLYFNLVAECKHLRLEEKP